MQSIDPKNLSEDKLHKFTSRRQRSEERKQDWRYDAKEEIKLKPKEEIVMTYFTGHYGLITRSV